MDEEISIIDRNTRNQKIKDFFINNKKNISNNYNFFNIFNFKFLHISNL